MKSPASKIRKREPQIPATRASVWRTCNICGHAVNEDHSMTERKQLEALLAHKRTHTIEFDKKPKKKK